MKTICLAFYSFADMHANSDENQSDSHLAMIEEWIEFDPENESIGKFSTHSPNTNSFQI